MTAGRAASGLALACGVFAWIASGLIDPAAYASVDSWFQADLPYRLAMMTDHTSQFVRDQSHPAFAALTGVPVGALRLLPGVETVIAVRLVLASAAAAWAGLLCLVLRGFGCRPWDAALFTVLGAVSASFVFWSTVPETFLFGSLGFLLTLALAVRAEDRAPSWLGFAVTGALNLGITLTNIMVSGVATLLHFSWRRCGVVLLTAIALTGLVAGMVAAGTPPVLYAAGGLALLFAIRRWRRAIDRAAAHLERSWIFSARTVAALVMTGVAGVTVALTAPPLRDAVTRMAEQELRHVLPSSGAGPGAALRSIVVSTVIMPRPALTPDRWEANAERHLLLTQRSSPASAGALGVVGIALWLSVLGLGVWSFLSSAAHPKFRLIVGASLAGQILLHLVYGDETFLYSLHFLPFLVIIAAAGTLGRLRTLVLGLTVALVIVAATHNVREFRLAAAALNSLATVPPMAAGR